MTVSSIFVTFGGGGGVFHSVLGDSINKLFNICRFFHSVLGNCNFTTPLYVTVSSNFVTFGGFFHSILGDHNLSRLQYVTVLSKDVTIC